MKSRQNISGPDYSDTGEWQLKVRISGCGIDANIHSRRHGEDVCKELLTARWNESEEELLERIENSVYDHPEVLDDYSAEIIVETGKTLFVPKTIFEETENDSTVFFTEVYPVAPEDILSDETLKEVTTLFYLTSGLRSFLGRTFPGAKIRSHLSVIIEGNSRVAPGCVRLYCGVREGDVDLVLMSGERLISASVQPWSEFSDLIYRMFNVLDVYSLAGPETEIYITGRKREENEKLCEFARKYFHIVTVQHEA